MNYFNECETLYETGSGKVSYLSRFSARVFFCNSKLKRYDYTVVSQVDIPQQTLEPVFTVLTPEDNISRSHSQLVLLWKIVSNNPVKSRNSRRLYNFISEMSYA